MVLTDEEFANSLRSQLLKTTTLADDAKSKRDYYQAIFDRETTKADKLKTVLAFYPSRDMGTEEAENHHASSLETQNEEHVLTGFAQTIDSMIASERFIPKKERVRNRVGELLNTHASLHRNDILRTLTAENIMGSEKNPMASLAAYLSEFKEFFLPDGRGNFRLRKFSRASNAPPSVETHRDSNGSEPSEGDDVPENGITASRTPLTKENT